MAPDPKKGNPTSTLFRRSGKRPVKIPPKKPPVKTQPIKEAQAPLIKNVKKEKGLPNDSEGIGQQSTQPMPEYNDYRLVSVNKIRTHNIMRLTHDKPVDLTTFTPPLKLKRRERGSQAASAKDDAQSQSSSDKQQTAGTSAGTSTPAGNAAGTQAGGKAARGGRGVQTKADTSIIAPFGGATRNKQMLFKKRTKQVFFADENQRRLNIEESRPWMFEDYDAQNSWTGTLEGGQKSNYFLFVLIDDGFKVVPVDRWYNFRQKLKYRTLTIEEAEEEYIKATKGAKAEQTSRWLMKNKEKEDKNNGPQDVKPEDLAFEEDRKPFGNGGDANSSLVEYTAEYDEFDDDVDGGAGSSKKRSSTRNTKHGDIEEVDFDEVFEDDEEMPEDLFAGDEAEKDTKPNTGGVGLGNSDDEEFEDADESKLGSSGREMKKLMFKREQNKNYGSDSDDNPYLDKSDIESDSDGEFEEDESPSAKKDNGNDSSNPDKKGESGGSKSTQESQSHAHSKHRSKLHTDSPTGASSPTSAGSQSPGTPSLSGSKPKSSASSGNKQSAKRKRVASMTQGKDGPSQKTAKSEKRKTSGTKEQKPVREEEVIRFIRGHPELRSTDLINHFRSRIGGDESKKHFLGIVKKVSKLTTGGILTLKNAYQR
ncbi:transcription factor IIF subunit tfg1 [Mycoemilia scoparia]|uniref:Transcription initiation factor IIF subunit alpha n=1 Tax=Mycoemilia scoparia TaxID=417184 RepID=A0A9W8DTU5_9FUNG|nr:transcription factor IIF subunit tfg1 [Mycoemilia scoparia]